VVVFDAIEHIKGIPVYYRGINGQGSPSYTTCRQCFGEKQRSPPLDGGRPLLCPLNKIACGALVRRLLRPPLGGEAWPLGDGASRNLVQSVYSSPPTWKMPQSAMPGTTSFISLHNPGLLSSSMSPLSSPNSLLVSSLVSVNSIPKRSGPRKSIDPVGGRYGIQKKKRFAFLK